MSVLLTIQVAVAALKRNLLRTCLTMLGLIIGVCVALRVGVRQLIRRA